MRVAELIYILNSLRLWFAYKENGFQFGGNLFATIALAKDPDISFNIFNVVFVPIQRFCKNELERKEHNSMLIVIGPHHFYRIHFWLFTPNRCFVFAPNKSFRNPHSAILLVLFVKIRRNCPPKGWRKKTHPNWNGWENGNKFSFPSFEIQNFQHIMKNFRRYYRPGKWFGEAVFLLLLLSWKSHLWIVEQSKANHSHMNYRKDITLF